MSQYPKKYKEPLHSEVSILNPQILNILNESADLGFFTENSIIHYDSKDYEKESIEHTKNDNLVKFKNQKQIIKYKCNTFGDNTPGGINFYNKLVPIIGDGYEGPRTSLYNPRGYIGWHKDDSYKTYLLAFMYCVGNPDGFYSWEDRETGEIQTIIEKPGWTCRSSVHIDNNTSEWHACKTNTPKILLGFTYPNYTDFLKAKEIVHSDKYNYETIKPI